LAFSRFIQRPLRNENRNRLEYELDHGEEKDEDAKHLIGEALDGILIFEEGKPDEQRLYSG
jgi:hypothetical protein